jgi:hypothetical protein
MSDINLSLSPKELEVLQKELEGSDSDAPEITALLERVTTLVEAHPVTAAEAQG